MVEPGICVAADSIAPEPNATVYGHEKNDGHVNSIKLDSSFFIVTSLALKLLAHLQLISRLNVVVEGEP